MPDNIMFSMQNIEKSFHGVTVFKDFSIDFRKGEIHCICGENGAGKSTLIKILSGVYQADKGTICFEGKPVVISDPRAAKKLGIQTIYQEHTLFSKLTVTENLFAGNEIVKHGIVDEKTMRERTQDILRYLKSGISPDTIVQELTDGEQKMVEIARGLLYESQLFILDEPTSSFGKNEIGYLFEVLNKMREDGKSIIYISHHLEETFEIADRITVIRDGEKISTYNPKDITESRLINDMVGRDVDSFYKREEVPKGEVLFEVEGLKGNGVKNITFNVRRGEIIGFSGMVGAGKTEMAELLFGVKAKTGGVIKINNKRVEIRQPKDAIRNKMCFITESRQHTGLFLKHSILRNIVITNYRKRKGALANPHTDRQIAREYMKKLNVVSPTYNKKVEELSGGNQQKVVLAKWFSTDGEIFIFDEPTKGIDIGAKEEIYKIMTNLIKEGKSIILISSDMPELIAMSDRVCVMRDGCVVGELNRQEVTEQSILKYAIG